MKQARAPGKIILSGEHAVVYGAPAIVCAVQRYTTIGFAPMHRSRTIRTALSGISGGKHYRTSALQQLKAKLDRRFDQYNRGERAVQNILRRPDDLVIYSLATLLQHIPLPGFSSNRRLPVPGRLSSNSELPLGAGMGSSAAAIAATLVLYENLTGYTMSAQQRFERVRFCERLQHGRGSAIDAAATVYGGIQSLHDGTPTPLETTLNGNWYWILSGIPIVSTGECVAHVRQHHSKDHTLWQQFADTTLALQNALENDSDPRAALQENHRLLTHIGVVPAPAAALIAAVEAAGGAAKISGAGAHRGEGGGIILAYHPDPQALPLFLNQSPVYRWENLHIAEQGAHILPDTDSTEALTASAITT
ncbi:MAG: GHMP kinase [Cardiobacteriaceae bacterium]|nr:GHMP kinase [Cardiobacteriaceae bacterium]